MFYYIWALTYQHRSVFSAEFIWYVHPETATALWLRSRIVPHRTQEISPLHTPLRWSAVLSKPLTAACPRTRLVLRTGWRDERARDHSRRRRQSNPVAMVTRPSFHGAAHTAAPPCARYQCVADAVMWTRERVDCLRRRCSTSLCHGKSHFEGPSVAGCTERCAQGWTCRRRHT